MKNMAAVNSPNVKKENNFSTNPTAPFAKDSPSKMFVIHTGQTLSMKRAASPNVQTTIRDDFRFSISSSLYVMVVEELTAVVIKLSVLHLFANPITLDGFYFLLSFYIQSAKFVFRCFTHNL